MARITIDTNKIWVFQAAQVGSSIFGDLLKPNDIDIAVCLNIPWCKKALRSYRLGKFNLILLTNISLLDYINSFDMQILKGYKSLLTRQLCLTHEAKKSLQYKEIVQCCRGLHIDELFKKYDTNQVRDRALKYLFKTPKGWTFHPVWTVEDEIQPIINQYQQMLNNSEEAV